MDTAPTPAVRSQVHTEVRRPLESVVSRIVFFAAGVIEVLLAVRFALELLGANAKAGFVQFVYSLSAPFMLPFNAIFGTTEAAGSTLEWSVLVAIVVYALVAWGIVALIRAANPRSQASTVERTES